MWKHEEIPTCYSLLVSSKQVLPCLTQQMLSKCRVVLFVFQMLMAGRLSKEMGLLQNSNGHSAIGMCLAQHDSQTLSILQLLVCMVFFLQKPTQNTKKSGQKNGVRKCGHLIAQCSGQQCLQKTSGASALFDKVMAQYSRTGCPGGQTLVQVPTSVKWGVSRSPIKTRNKDSGQICGSTEKQMEK